MSQDALCKVSARSTPENRRYGSLQATSSKVKVSKIDIGQIPYIWYCEIIKRPKMDIYEQTDGTLEGKQPSRGSFAWFVYIRVSMKRD